LLLMFSAGLEIDIALFRRAQTRSNIFGLPFTPLSFAGVARRTARPIGYGVAATPYYRPYGYPGYYPPPDGTLHAPHASAIDLANDISELISEVWLKGPGISNADLTNGLIAAYCPLVAQPPGLTTAQRWSRMHRFVRVLQQQLAANDLPPGPMIIAEVPVPPSVYRQLRSEAEAGGQTPTQFMGSILTAAAGR
jgi:hypothetical protein